MAKRIKVADVDLTTLEHIPEGDGGWADYKWECYRLKVSETDKTVSQSLLRVDYRLDNLTKTWREKARYRYYKRHSKYLAINGTHEGQYVVATTPGYYLYYSNWRHPDEFPRKVLLQTDTLAKRLGLKW